MPGGSRRSRAPAPPSTSSGSSGEEQSPSSAEVSRGGRLPLNQGRFPQKEVEFLRSFERAGGFAFVAAAFWQHQKIVVVPFRAVSGLIGLLPSISLSEMCGVGREVKSVTGLFGCVGSLLGGMELEGSSLYGD